jgi:hypothetical protein
VRRGMSQVSMGVSSTGIAWPARVRTKRINAPQPRQATTPRSAVGLTTRPPAGLDGTSRGGEDRETMLGFEAPPRIAAPVAAIRPGFAAFCRDGAL